MTTITRFTLITLSVLSVAAPAWARQAPQDVDRLTQNQERLKATRERLQADKDRRKADLERIGPEYTEPFSKSFRVGPKGMLDLTNIAGDVTITTGSGDDVKIDAVKRVHGVSDADARAALQELTVQVNERAGLLEVRTEFPRRGPSPNGPGATRSPLSRSGWSVDYAIRVPTGTSLTLHTISGDVQVTGVKGDITTNSISGDVTVRDSKPRAVDVETVSGTLRFAAVESDRVQLRSVSGDIDYSGKLARSGRYDMQSHSGDIRIVAPESSGFDIEATTFSGDVRSDYPLTVRSRQGDGLAGLPRLNRSMRGSFGDASAILTLRSFSGDIVVAKK